MGMDADRVEQLCSESEQDYFFVGEFGLLTFFFEIT